ncbi:hypothetical protein TNCV_4217071 [Trichonephila clavipes]|nr:hypothetical protein TNCV_4217071 [Trichonephila clavipes]
MVPSIVMFHRPFGNFIELNRTITSDSFHSVEGGGQGNGLVAGMLSVRACTVEDTPCRGGRCALNLSRHKRPHVGVEFRKGECQLRCRPRHLTIIQNSRSIAKRPSCS